MDGRAGGVGTFGLLWMAGKRTDFGWVGQRVDYPISAQQGKTQGFADIMSDIMSSSLRHTFTVLVLNSC